MISDIMKIVDFDPIHVKQIDLQPHQKQWQDSITHADFETLKQNSWTILNGDKPIFIGGFVRLHAHRVASWTLLSADAGRYMIRIARFCKLMCNYNIGCRVECYVDCDFSQGHRFALMVGFKLEAARMIAFEIDGRDAAMYSMFIEDKDNG